MKFPYWTKEDTRTTKVGCFVYIVLPFIIFCILALISYIALAIEYIYHLFVH